MNITKSQLKRIIKEELIAVMEGEELSIDAQEIKRYEWPQGKTSFDDEEDVLPMIQDVIGSLEISDPGMPNWDRSKDQIVYLGSIEDRGKKTVYFKTSNSGHYYKLDI